MIVGLPLCIHKGHPVRLDQREPGKVRHQLDSHQGLGLRPDLEHNGDTKGIYVGERLGHHVKKAASLTTAAVSYCKRVIVRGLLAQSPGQMTHLLC